MLETRRSPLVYRVHDEPSREKIEALAEVLDSAKIPFAKGQALRPGVFNHVLERAKATPHADMINEVVLRTQAQAEYAAANIGHFGLNLRRYAHFTSPIRRYADLLVHRGLIAGLGLGDDGLPPDAVASFPEIGAHISATERRAATAERDALDRFTAAFLADRVGEIFAGRVNGVTRFGLFVTLADSGADGLVPISSLPADLYDHDEGRHALVGRRRGRVYSLGDTVWARLVEAEPVTGGLLFNLVEGEQAPEPSPQRRPARSVGGPRPGRKGRPAGGAPPRAGPAKPRRRPG